MDVTNLPVDRVPALIRSNAAAWGDVLGRGDVAERPSDDRWSTLEYACHVRDVLLLYHERLQLMLAEDDPTFPDWDQDEAAVACDYGRQDPAAVARDIDAAAVVLAEAFEKVAGDQWQRLGTRSDGSRFTVDTFARYFIHDPVHHIWDVTENPDHRR